MSKGTPRTHTESFIECPTCGSTCSAVVDSRPCDTFAVYTIRRRRECAKLHRFTTYESVLEPITSKQADRLERLALLAAIRQVLLP